METVNILTVDVETYPGESYTWGIRKQYVALNQVKKDGGLLCFAAKFHGERKMHFHSLWEDGAARMVREAHRLLSDADAVVGYNSDKFDVRWLNAQFLKHGLARPSPFAKVDLIKSLRRQVALPSYRLAYVAQWLGIGDKLDTGGFELWPRVMAGEPQARALMRRYNMHDVRITEAVYDRMAAKGWVLGLPNASIEGGDVCPNPECQSERRQSRGHNYTKTRKYPRFQCVDCGTWYQSTHGEPYHARFKVCA